MRSAFPVVRDSAMLGRLLRDARRARGWTQYALAQQAGVGQPTVSNVERGAGKASIDTLWRLLAALELDIAIVSRAPRDAASAWERD